MKDTAFPSSSRVLRRLLQGLGVLLLSGLVAALVLLALALHDQPLVRREAASMSAEDLLRVKLLLRAADPRHPAPQAAGRGADGTALRVLRADSRDIDLLLNDATQRLLRLPSRLVPGAGSARLQASLEMPASPFGRWLNIEADLRETAGLPVLERLRLGGVPVPPALAEALLRHELTRRGLIEQAELLIDMVRRVSLQPQEVEIAYVWREDTPDRLRASLVPQALQQRLQAHAGELARLARKAPEPAPLATLLQPMLGFAAGRCGLDCPPQDLAAEHRAALVVLALHAAGQPLSRIVPQARDWPRPPARTVTLLGRPDFAMHFLVSAVLAAEGGGRLADAIGIYKEVIDSRDGSGFSFNDIAADRAGTRFGQIAVQDPGRLRAAALQDADAALKEADFMPPVDGLPEFMPQAEFQARYGGIGAAPYRRMMAEIEQRVMSRPLLR